MPLGRRAPVTTYGGIYLIEQKQDLDMRELRDPRQRVGGEGMLRVMYASSPPQKSSTNCLRIALTKPIASIVIVIFSSIFLPAMSKARRRIRLPYDSTTGERIERITT